MYIRLSLGEDVHVRVGKQQAGQGTLTRAATNVRLLRIELIIRRYYYQLTDYHESIIQLLRINN